MPSRIGDLSRVVSILLFSAMISKKAEGKMPKHVDHDLRREDLAKAAYKVIARRGLAAATMRDVSTAAGWSSGAIVHYLSSKDDLLLAAARYSFARTRVRMQAIRAQHKGIAALRLVNRGMLPFGDEMVGLRRMASAKATG